MDMPGGKRVEATDPGDRISGLPNEMLRHIMSFLPARDATRTCVLSPRWRHLWATVPRLNIDAEGFTSQSRFIEFVNAVLLSRGSIPLESFWLRANGPGIFLENFYDTACLWIRHALRSNVEELGVIDHDQNDNADESEFFQLYHWPFTSSCLKKLHLCYVRIHNDAIKKLFYGCTALEDLEIINCVMSDTEFSSATLKNLSINYVQFPNSDDYDIHVYIVINMPSLVSLHVGALLSAELSLVDVQSLITASISVARSTFTGACENLGAVSNVKKLELLFPCGVDGLYELPLPSDAQLFQVVFANLTSLSLSDWCLRDNCKVLLYLLEHSPNLEEIALEMTELRHRPKRPFFYRAAAVDSPCEEIAAPFTCDKLKKIEIACPEGDKAVGQLVTILLTNIICPPEIRINPFPYHSRVRNFKNCWS